MTDDELMDEIEELLETKIVYFSESSKICSAIFYNKYIEMATKYTEALNLFRKMREKIIIESQEDKREIL